MKSNLETHLRHQYETLQELFQEYDYQIMAAKNEAVLYVIGEISEHLIMAHKYLEGQIPIEINIDKEICSLDLIVSAEQTFRLPTLLKFVNKSSAKNYKSIRICSKTDDRTNFEYSVMFNDSLSLIILENDEKELILNLDDYCKIDNTFSDQETDALLFTLAFVVLGLSSKQKEKTEACKVIYLSEYKK